MTAQRDDIADNIKETAAYWIVRLAAPDCTPEDRCAFEAWRRADPEHREAYDRQKRGEAFVDRNVGHPLLQEFAEEVRAETEPQWNRRRAMKWGALAASLFVFVTASIFAFNTLAPFGDTRAIAAVEAYETAIGERSTIVLADGTSLTLNTNSKVEVDFKAEQRDIKLLRGQALFEVAKDMDRPFVVEAGGQRIVALGTAFDVRLDDRTGVQVTLIEGRVSVDEVLKASAGVEEGSTPETLPRSSKVVLNAGERFVATSAAPAKVTQADIEEITSWRDGRLVFRKKPLPDVIAEMNRYSAQQLVLSDDYRLQDMTVSGVFDTGRTSGFVFALETMHPLEAQRTGQRELTLVWRE